MNETQNNFNGINLYAYCGNNPIMYTDENGYFFGFLITAILIGAVFGGVASGISAYNDGARSWNLFGAILGGAIFGGAMGAVSTLGGAVGLATFLKASFDIGKLLALSLCVGILASLTAYSAEALIRSDMQWNLKNFTQVGISGMIKSAFTFATGFLGGKLGAFDKLKLNSMLKGAKTIDMNLTYAMSKVMFLNRHFALTPITETLFKLLGISGVSAGFRYLIDKGF